MSGAVTEQAKRFNFPILNKVVLRDFSLFPRRNEIVVEFRDGVVCLAGANGVGKSTFIAAVNFGLTGRVPDPERAFESINEYYAYTETFSEDYLAVASQSSIARLRRWSWISPPDPDALSSAGGCSSPTL